MMVAMAWMIAATMVGLKPLFSAAPLGTGVDTGETLPR